MHVILRLACRLRCSDKNGHFCTYSMKIFFDFHTMLSNVIGLCTMTVRQINFFLAFLSFCLFIFFRVSFHVIVYLNIQILVYFLF